MKIARTTKVAIRVALALSLSMVIATVLHLPHVLWVFFVATSTAAGSLGLSVQRSVQRAVTTVAGSLVGAGLHLVTEQLVWADQLLFALSLFFAVYFLSYSYTTFLFFMAILFVSIVGLREAFSVDALVYRIVDTAVGAGCALVASLVVFPIRASDLFRSHLIRLAENCQQRFMALAETFLSQEPDAAAIRRLEEEARGIFKEAHDALNERKYERIFGNFFPRNGGLLLTQLEHLVTLLRGLSHTVKNPTSLLGLDRTRQDIEAYMTQIDRAFDEIEEALRKKRRAAQESNTQKIRRQIMLKVLALIPPDKPHMRQWLNYHTFLNYLYRIDNLLTDAVKRIT